MSQHYLKTYSKPQHFLNFSFLLFSFGEILLFISEHYLSYSAISWHPLSSTSANIAKHLSSFGYLSSILQYLVIYWQYLSHIYRYHQCQLHSATILLIYKIHNISSIFTLSQHILAISQHIFVSSQQFSCKKTLDFFPFFGKNVTQKNC